MNLTRSGAQRRSGLLKAIALSSTALVAASNAAYAAPIDWVGGANSAFEDAANWSGSTNPSNNEVTVNGVTLPSVPPSVGNAIEVQVNALAVKDGGVLTIANGGRLRV